ncbi:hypothetical protein [Aliivibrio finisterrensis]|uniref:Outer membrane protein beta-barrel domain-containing protein n=1 Tax=Aliivibrio finisterrensis TaxID=511998 RepID=A0A6N6RWE0_9GAMM|nr:hypothetical protein [Aliivibrio finisterrensis]KAB2826046.1 hypothetical protein F8B77_02195 [Aliivibrio finisterrensis]
MNGYYVSLLIFLSGFFSSFALASNTEISLGFGMSDYKFQHYSSELDTQDVGMALNLTHYPYVNELSTGVLSLGARVGINHPGNFHGSITADDANDLGTSLMSPGPGVSLSAVSKYQYNDIFFRAGIGALYWSNSIYIDEVKVRDKNTSILYSLEAGYQVAPDVDLSIGATSSSYKGNMTNIYLFIITFHL